MSDGIIEITLAAVLSLVGAGTLNLLGRIRKMETNQVRIVKVLETIEARDSEISKIRECQHSMRMDMAGKFLTREDWVPTASRILGELEKQREMLSRHDERMKQLTKRL